MIRLRRSIGYVIQDVGLFPHFTVERNIGLVPRIDGWPADRIHASRRRVIAARRARFARLLLDIPISSREDSGSEWESPVLLPPIPRFF